MRGNLSIQMQAALLAFAIWITAGIARAEDPVPYKQHIDVQFTEAKGEPLYMDIFVPTGENRLPQWKPTDHGKGLGIIDVATGAWHSDRGKIQDHMDAQFYNIFCARGYTVFAVRPGSRGDFTALEMVENVKRAICYVKQNAEKYNIDPDRLGITGASAGGHVASLTVLTSEPAEPEAKEPLDRCNTGVQAAGVFFPPTDFLDWEGKSVKEVAERLGDIWFVEGVEGKSDEVLAAAAKASSPRHLVSGKTIPFMIFHGDADPLVPLQQSEVFVRALREAGNEAQLFVKPNGTHPWITIPLEVMKLADWFDHQLAGAPAPEPWKELWTE